MKLKRYEHNPILEANPDRAWESGAVFNCGAALGPDGRFHLLYRAIAAGYTPSPDRPGYTNYVSSIGLAVSEDGRNFSRFERPVIEPTEAYEIYGCEDPRVNRLQMDGEVSYLITYTALSAPAYSGLDRVALASTEDFRTYTKHGIVIPGLNDKDAVIFPELINGQIVMLHRVAPNVQIVYFDAFEQLIHPDESFWRRYRASLEEFTIMRPRFEWEAKKIGAGCPPIKTKEGWLVIYHARDNQAVYRAGVVLLDLDDPARVIARSPYPILEPEAEYERIGDVNNVVFPQGAVVEDDRLYVYYGAADKRCCLATARLDEFIAFVTQSKE